MKNLHVITYILKLNNSGACVVKLFKLKIYPISTGLIFRETISYRYNKFLRYLLSSLFVYLFSVFSSYGQFYFLDDAVAKIELEFAKPRTELKAKSLFFNILTIINRSEREQPVIVNLSVPEAWNLIGDNVIHKKLGPLDTIRIPVRVALSKEVRGEIGYAVVATVTDEEGNVIKSVQSFINIPRESKLIIKPLSRINYFDQKTGKSSIKIKLENKGNVDEIVYMEMKTEYGIMIPGEIKKIFAIDVTLGSFMDTIVEFPVFLNEQDNLNKNSYSIKLKANYQDISYTSSIWFKKLNNSYTGIISEGKKPLIVVLSGQDLFSDFQANYTSYIIGTVLFKKDRDIFYYYKNYGSDDRDDLIKFSRMWVGYKDKNVELLVGDISENFGQTIYGRGLDVKIKSKHHIIKANASKNPITPTVAYGLGYDYASKKNLNFGVNGSYRYNNITNIKSNAGLIYTKFRLFKNQGFNLSLATSEEYRYKAETLTSKTGYGFGLGYSANYNEVKSTVVIRYGDRNYSGSYNGKLEIRGQVTYLNKNGKNSYIYYIRNRYNPSVYISDSLLPEYISDFEQTRIDYSFLWTPQVYVNVAPIFERQSSNAFLGFNKNEIFRSRYYSIKSGIRFRDANSYTTLSPSFRVGLNKITEYSRFLKGENVESNLDLSPYAMAIFTVNLNSRYWGFYISYYYGPNSINQQFNYFYNNFFTKTIRVMPYFEKYLYKDKIRLSSRANYLGVVNTKSNSTNFSNEINFFLKNELTISVLNTFAYQTTYDAQIDETYKFSSSYFEIRVKKEFGFPQPRLKFYDLNVVFFKDLNGDRAKADNEPGIRNILVNFIRNESADKVDAGYEYQGEFSNVELLSDQKGLISYGNLPEGIYNIEFNVLNKNNGNFTAETNNLSIHINKDKTIFIPFFENNKIFGKVILSRSKLSNLGDIDISNLKITATDRDGRVTSTLTDKNGNFMLYVPDVDKYTVKINNIFYENFDLQQNNFEVQLNGYKQFELTFVFNEKRRRIRFSSEYEAGRDMQTMKLEIVRRTNLKGTVKDATTQIPIKAKVKIFDDDNNVIAKTNSDVITGLYNLSFLAGENYKIVASADNYWFFLDKLYERQITTFQNIQKDILLKKITVGSIIPLTKLLFDEGKAYLKSEATAELDRLLEVLKYNPTVRISIHGHADDFEVLDVDPEIAEERAKMVAKYLIANGYSRVEYIGHRNNRPVAPNDNAVDRQKNRRVEVVVKSK